MDNTSFIPKELKEKNVYGILGLSESEATKENLEYRIRKQYLKKALHLHPDKKDAVVQTEGSIPKAEKIKTENTSSSDDFNLLKCAYDFLMNPTLRKKYNEHIKEKKRIKENKFKEVERIKRYTDNRIFEERRRKEKYKRKLEEREQNIENEKDPCKHLEKKKVSELTEEDRMNQIKKENEDFIKHYKKNKHKKKYMERKKEKENDISSNTEEEKQRQINIYLKDYKNNIDLLKSFIKEKVILRLFEKYTVVSYNVHIHENIEEEEQNEIEPTTKQIGYVTFVNRSEAIMAYSYYKMNEDLLNQQFKLTLEIPFKEKIETFMNFCSNSSQEPTTTANIEIDEMNQMEQELEKLCSSF